MRDTPTGLSSISPRDPIGVRVTTGRKGPSGAPMFGSTDRFWLCTVETMVQKFSKSSSPTSSLHPSFVAWNDLAEKTMNKQGERRPAGRVAALRGNLVHATPAECVQWYRAASQLPEPHPNPPSKRAACTGNEAVARRFSGIGAGDVETYEEIACPGEDCIFAQRRLCKVQGDLLFRLRWDSSDPLERNFPALLAMYHTGGMHSVSSIMGLFEFVLGTEAVQPTRPREEWKKGLAAELGVENPSLVGLPFVMTVGKKTNRQNGNVYTIVNFSPDGDLIENWLLAQVRLRGLLGSSISAPALPPADIRSESAQVAIDEARSEFDPASVVIDVPPMTPSGAAADVTEERRRLGADILATVSREDAPAVLSNLLTVDGNPGPSTVADLSLEDVSRAREAMKLHPLFLAKGGDVVGGDQPPLFSE